MMDETIKFLAQSSEAILDNQQRAIPKDKQTTEALEDQLAAWEVMGGVLHLDGPSDGALQFQDSINTVVYPDTGPRFL